MPSFYNTNQTPSQMLIEFERDALNQEDLVIEVYRANKKAMAWWEVSSFLPDIHEGSIKRSITNLCYRGILRKTDELVTGKYGKQTHKYQLT